MKYGARYIRFAPVIKDNIAEGAAPTYGEAITLGGLQKVTDNPSFATAKGHWDDALRVTVTEFVECPIDIEINEISHEVGAAVLGATLDKETGDLAYGGDDNAPDGGLGFVCAKMLAGKRKVYEGIYYPIVSASMQGEEFAGKGESIVLSGSKLHLIGKVDGRGKWKIRSKYFDTVEEATKWVDGKLSSAALDPEDVTETPAEDITEPDEQTGGTTGE